MTSPVIDTPLMNTYPPHHTVFVRGAGTELFDAAGRRHLDFLCGLAVTSLGHAHPAVTEAIGDQAATLVHVSNLFGTTVGPEVAATIDGLHGGGGRVFFANSGAEANEAALKLARRHGGYGRHVVVSTYGSFHGRTLATLAATGQPTKHEPFAPMPEGFRHVAVDDLDAMERAVDDTVAGVLVEVVRGEGGVEVADADWLSGVARICGDRGALLMIDEIQTGLARTGRWWAYEHFGLVPDVVTMAKALGNGVPIGACWARGEVAASMRPGDHGSTFGGQPLAAAAARAVLAVMAEIDAPARAAAAGQRLRSELERRAWVSEVRGLGLLLAAELDPATLDGRSAPQVAAELLAAGLIVNGVTPTALRLAPPLIVTDDEIDEALAICDAVVPR